MKKNSLILCCMAVMGLTSCLFDEDENKELTSQDVSRCFNAIKGNHSGSMLFENHNPDDATDNVDTLDIAWTITADTTVVISRFPQAVILDRISDKDLKEALTQAEPAQLKALIGFYQTDPIGFRLYPLPVEYNIEYQNAAHKAKLIFWVNNYSYGQYDASSRAFRMQLMAAGLYLDEDETHSYLINPSYDNTSIPIIITNVNLNK